MNPTKSLLAIAAVATLATGCYSRKVVVHEPAGVAPVPVATREVIVTQTPPPAPIEEMGRAPKPNSVWVPGYWKRAGTRWEWVQGKWETIPRGYNTYEPGHWVQRNDGWVYYPGSWR